MNKIVLLIYLAAMTVSIIAAYRCAFCSVIPIPKVLRNTLLASSGVCIFIMAFWRLLA